MKNSTAIILIIISIGLFYTFIDPQYDKVKALKVEAGEYGAVLENVSALEEKRDALLVDYEAISPAELEKLSKVLPDNIDTVQLAVDLDGIAARYGISIKNVQVLNTIQGGNNIMTEEEVADRPHVEKVDVSFGFVATYVNFKKFLRDIEQSLRITNVKSVNFVASENGLYDYVVTVETYWLK